jgi:hypothetical protein
MYSRMTLVLSLAFVLAAGSAFAAAPVTSKARGIYGNSYGWVSSGGGRSHRSYGYRASTAYCPPAASVATAVPAAPAAPAAIVAQAPVEGRRFSYAPTAEASAPAMTAPRTYSSHPSYSGGGGRRSSIDRWALPKTDPRKYNSR